MCGGDNGGRTPTLFFLKFIQTTKLLWLGAYAPNNMQQRWLWMRTWLPRKSMFQFWKLRLEFNLYIYDLKHLNLKKIILILFFWNSLLNYLNLKKNWKLIFQFWKLLFQFFKELVEFEIWYLNLKFAISFP